MQMISSAQLLIFPWCQTLWWWLHAFPWNDFLSVVEISWWGLDILDMYISDRVNGSFGNRRERSWSLKRRLMYDLYLCQSTFPISSSPELGKNFGLLSRVMMSRPSQVIVVTFFKTSNKCPWKERRVQRGRKWMTNRRVTDAEVLWPPASLVCYWWISTSEGGKSPSSP